MQKRINFRKFFDGMVGYNEILDDDKKYYMVVIDENINNILTEAQIDESYLNDDYEDEAQELVDDGEYDNLEDALESVKQSYEDSFYYDYVKDFDVKKRNKIIKRLRNAYEENQYVQRQIDMLIDEENVLSYADYTSRPSLTAASIHLRRSGIPKDLRKVIIGSLDRREPINFTRPLTIDHEKNEFIRRLQEEALQEEDEFRQRQNVNRRKRLREDLDEDYKQEGGRSRRRSKSLHSRRRSKSLHSRRRSKSRHSRHRSMSRHSRRRSKSRHSRRRSKSRYSRRRSKSHYSRRR
jgi:hypothetical protein